MRLFSHLIAGALFGTGLVLAGMTDPARVKGFLSLGADWDISLALTMLAAIVVHFPVNRWLLQKRSPFMADQFFLPEREAIDRPLIFGAALFGIGWGWAGYCPGPAITSLARPTPDTLTFVVALLLGMALHRLVTQLLTHDLPKLTDEQGT